MTKKRTYREPLDPVWAETLLSVPSKRSADKTVAQVLTGLRDAFATAVADAEEILKEHPFAEVIATEAARRAGRRGEASLTVGKDGQVYLEINYKSQKSEAAEDDKEARKWNSKLPSIGELRDRARQLGIDPEPFGRSKVKLQEAIEAAEATKPEKAAPEVSPKPKMMRTGDAVGPVRVLNPSEGSPLADAVKAASSVDLDSLTSK
tara:strand:- start:5620 stop:6237 length:618 start_codon:yes stop_codon:yes gene_type:complete